MKKIKSFDFGNLTVEPAAGFIKVDRVYLSPRYLWISDIKHTWRQEVKQELLSDFVWLEEGEFRIGLPKGKYNLKMKFYDPLQNHGPFNISIGSVNERAPIRAYEYTIVEEGMVVKADALIEKEYEIEHQGGALAINFLGIDGKTFMINSLELFGPEYATLEILFPDAPSDTLPSIKELDAKKTEDLKTTLKKIADWLVNHLTFDGFLGDYEGTQRIWYTSSYPIRTLLAAFEILGDQKYLDVSIEILDKLVEEQMADGAFTQSYRNQPTNQLSEEEINKVRESNWMNLADIGSIVAALAASCFYLEGKRRETYIDSIKNYCDNWVMKFKQENGAFLNGWLAGHYAEWIYNVSTATTALTFAIFSKVTKDNKYLEDAEKAIEFLLEGWNEDGRPYSAPHDYCSPGKPWYQNVLQFGDLFYVHESIAITARHSKNKELRKKVFETSRKHLFGSKGLLASKEGLSWWPLDDTWVNSKSAGMPIVLLDFLSTASEFGAKEEEIEKVKIEYERCKKFLSIPEYYNLIGVVSEDPDLPWGPHSVQSWTGCSVAATGFAGIAVAEMIKPGIIYMTSEK